MKKLTDNQELIRLREENRRLIIENRGLKKLVNSKRFQMAEKIATKYNLILPKNTKRRSVVEFIVRSTCKGRKNNSGKINSKIKKDHDTLCELLKKYSRIIVVNSIPWDTKLKQRPHHLASELSKLGFFVIYLEQDGLNNLRIINENIITINRYQTIIGLPNIKKCYFLTPNNINTPLKILKELKDNGFEIIYDYLDEFHEDISSNITVQFDVWDNLKELEPVLCLATADRLYQELRMHLDSYKHILLVRNAVNIKHFDYTKKINNHKPPSDLKKILSRKNPIIGFYGAMAPWIDYKLLNNLAKDHQNWEFVFLGIDYGDSVSNLKQGSNVHFLGPKDYSELPNYAKYFNCAIIPFKEGDIAKATSPVKLFEYMAAGLPTVCTKDLEECRGYDYVYIAKNAKEFSKYLEQAIKDHEDQNIRKRLLEQAEENTWEQRAKDIDQALSK